MPSRSARRNQHKRLARLQELTTVESRKQRATHLLIGWRAEARRRADSLGVAAVAPPVGRPGSKLSSAILLSSGPSVLVPHPGSADRRHLVPRSRDRVGHSMRLRCVFGMALDGAISPAYTPQIREENAQDPIASLSRTSFVFLFCSRCAVAQPRFAHRRYRSVKRIDT